MAALTRPSRRWRPDRGAELVEFALVLPLMLLVLLGIIDFGMLFQRYHVVTNAAREGARVAVLPGYSDPDVQTRVTQFLIAGGLTEPAVTTVLPVQSRSVGPGLCVEVRPVTVQYPYTYSAVGAVASYFDGTGFNRSGLQATAEMRNEVAAGTCP